MRQQEKGRITLAYCQVVWNRVEPKDVPTLKELLEDGNEKNEQTVMEQQDILKSFAARSKRGGGMRGKKI